jgi:putative flippase GtrA
MPFELAIAFAYIVGMACAFLLMRGLAFEGAGKPMVPQVGRFLVVNALALAQTFIVSLLMARWVLPAMGIDRQAEAIGHLVGVLFPVFTSFLAHRAYTFR